MKIAIVIHSNDSETVWNAFRFGNTALANESKVTVFLIGKGVEALLGCSEKYDVHSQLRKFRDLGGRMVGCGVCMDSRQDDLPYLVNELQCETGSMQQLHELVDAADKVLTF